MNTIVQDKLDELRKLCARYRVRQLELFGSATEEQFDPASSDLDFLVTFQPLKFGEYADTYFGLLEELQTLFDRPVDLVMSTAVKNRFFEEAIRKKRVTLYAA